MVPLFGLREVFFIESIGILLWEQVVKPIVGSVLRFVMTIVAAIFFSIAFVIFGIGIVIYLLVLFCIIVYGVSVRGLHFLSTSIKEYRKYGKYCFGRRVKAYIPLRMKGFSRRS